MLRRVATSKVRLDRLLSNLGYTTRLGAKHFIQKHKITVHGARLLSLKGKVDPALLRIDGQPIDNRELNLVVHKPTGYVCSREKEQESKILYDMLPETFLKRKPILSIAGRLDKWVTGLVLMSQSGELVKRIISPKRKTWGKDYIVTAVHPYTGEEGQIFRSGKLMLKGETKPCYPANFEVLDGEKKIAKITLFEGRYHQVRRMLAATGNKAVAIHRARVGPISVGDLPLGKWRYMTNDEIRAISEGVGDKSHDMMTGLDKLKAEQDALAALNRAKLRSLENKEMEEIAKEDGNNVVADEDAEIREFQRANMHRDKEQTNKNKPSIKGKVVVKNGQGEGKNGKGEVEDGDEGEEGEEEEGEEEDDGERNEEEEGDEEDEEHDMNTIKMWEEREKNRELAPKGKRPPMKIEKVEEPEIKFTPKYDVAKLRAQALAEKTQKPVDEEQRGAQGSEEKSVKIEAETKSKEEKKKEEAGSQEKESEIKKEKEEPGTLKETRDNVEKQRDEPKNTKAAKVKKDLRPSGKNKEKKEGTEKDTKVKVKDSKTKTNAKTTAAKLTKTETETETKTKTKATTKNGVKNQETDAKQKDDKKQKKDKNKEEQTLEGQKATDSKTKQTEAKRKSGFRSLHEMAGEYEDNESEVEMRNIFQNVPATPLKNDFDIEKFEKEINEDKYASESQMDQLRAMFGVTPNRGANKPKKASVSKSQQAKKNKGRT